MQKFEFKNIEKHISLNEIQKASECFITGTAAEITPVSNIDKLKFEIKNENIANLLQKEFNQIVNEC